MYELRKIIILICMNYKFLDKVAKQLVGETRIDYLNALIKTPFFLYPLSIYLSTAETIDTPPNFPIKTHSQELFILFRSHCRSVYGLTAGEVIYVWDTYREIIFEKITGMFYPN
jgi:hypothetical protein